MAKCRNLSLDIILKCCCCNEFPWSEIFQCRNGHLICDKCYPKGVCSKCKVKLASEPEDKIRIQVLEDALDTIEFDCDYKEQGCGEKLIRNEMLNHLENCDYRPRLIKICEQIGLLCDFTVSSTKIPEALQHFREVHAFPLCESKELTISLKNVVSVDDESSYQDAVWTPVIVKLGKAQHSPVFLILGVFKEQEKIMQMLLWFFGDAASAGNYRGNFQISAEHSPLIPKFSWSENPCEVWAEGVDILTSSSASASFRLPAQFLQQVASPNNTSIAIKMTITGNANGNKEIPEREVNFEISIDRLCQVKVPESDPTCNNESSGSSASIMETEGGDEDEILCEPLTAKPETASASSLNKQINRKRKKSASQLSFGSCNYGISIKQETSTTVHKSADTSVTDSEDAMESFVENQPTLITPTGMAIVPDSEEETIEVLSQSSSSSTSKERPPRACKGLSVKFPNSDFLPVDLPIRTNGRQVSKLGPSGLPNSEHHETRSKKNGRFHCKCRRSYKDKPKLYRHIRSATNTEELKCEECGSRFLLLDTLKCHVETKHGPGDKFECQKCFKQYNWRSNLQAHQKICKGPKRT